MKKIFLGLAALSLGLTACTPTVTEAPPRLPEQVQVISRTALDFALNSFDAALYGLDFAMAAGQLTPGSERAKSIAAMGRKVQTFLQAAELARQAGNAASYEDAFRNANSALTEFRRLLGGAVAINAGERAQLTDVARTQILVRAAG